MARCLSSSVRLPLTRLGSASERQTACLPDLEPQLRPQHPQLLVRPVDHVGPVVRKGRSTWAAAGCAMCDVGRWAGYASLELIGLILLVVPLPPVLLTDWDLLIFIFLQLEYSLLLVLHVPLERHKSKINNEWCNTDRVGDR